jgi:hypothetical protein
LPPTCAFRNEREELMGIINRSCVAVALVAVSCATVSAQEFDPGKIRLGQTVVVRDASGYETKGVVQSVEPSKLVVKYGVGRLPDPADPGKLLNDSRAFTPAEVQRVRRPAPIWDGAVKGAAIAIVPVGIFTASCDCGAPPAGFVVMVGGIGAAIGLGIDAAWGPKTLYRGSGARRTLAIAPIAGKGRRGVAASIRF